jgi:hypothetical protein
MTPPSHQQNNQQVRDLVRSLIEREFGEMFIGMYAREKMVSDHNKNPSFLSFEQNYRVYNATNVTIVPPKGAIVMVDAGTTPTRAIALYLSIGNQFVEIFSKVI